jgi:hypothetical protein
VIDNPGDTVLEHLDGVKQNADAHLPHGAA